LANPLSVSPLQDFVATSSVMLDVLAQVECYAPARTPIILVGLTGTGKTRTAEVVHELSGRAGPLLSHSAGEFDPHLERSQIFGHARGAFTGAVVRQIGLLESAGDGTLLLDDFHHVTASTQITLLRALDRGAFRALGTTDDRLVRCRLVIGLTETPEALARRGVLLEELRFRLGCSIVLLPSLEQRRDDIPALALTFLSRCPGETGKMGPHRLAPEVVAVLQAASWPGNLRQLQMVVRDAYLRAGRSEVVRLRHVSSLVSLTNQFLRHGDPTANATAVRLALEATGGSVRDAAKLLHTSRTTIYGYLAPRGCQGPPFRLAPIGEFKDELRGA
jgi:DNA-binding NtrC family response regulator